jgi:hypothetical protein
MRRVSLYTPTPEDVYKSGIFFGYCGQVGAFLELCNGGHGINTSSHFHVRGRFFGAYSAFLHPFPFEPVIHLSIWASHLGTQHTKYAKI